MEQDTRMTDENAVRTVRSEYSNGYVDFKKYFLVEEICSESEGNTEPTFITFC